MSKAVLSQPLNIYSVTPQRPLWQKRKTSTFVPQTASNTSTVTGLWTQRRTTMPR